MIHVHLYRGFLFALFLEGEGLDSCLQNIRKQQTFLLATSAFTSCITLICDHKKYKCVFCPSSFKHYSVYFCGTKDCQVVTDKYFCQIVVEKNNDPLVLQYVDECFRFYCFI